MSAGERDRDEVLETVYHHRAGESSWSVFGSGRMSPAEILEDVEERGGEESAGVRAAVLGVMLDLVLEGWARRNDVERVGVLAGGLAVSFGHKGGFGLPLPGVRKVLGGSAAVPVVRKVLDSWFWDAPEVVELGKRLLAIGRFFNHPELEGWSVRSLAEVCGESRTWMMKRVRRECNGPIEFSGGKVKATWQQGEGQREVSRKARVRSARKRISDKEKTKND